MRDLIENARFGQRERAVVEMCIQQAEAAGVGTVEGTQRADVGLVVRLFHASLRHVRRLRMLTQSISNMLTKSTS